MTEQSLVQLLAAKQVELESELGVLSTPPDDATGISFGKRVGDGTSIAVERITQVAAHGRLGFMLADVLRAQDKVAEGSYGSCDRCGTPISSDRLDALPWATHCVTCPGG